MYWPAGAVIVLTSAEWTEQTVSANLDACPPGQVSSWACYLVGVLTRCQSKHAGIHNIVSGRLQVQYQ